MSEPALGRVRPHGVPHRLVVGEAIGFLIIVAAIWVDELWDLPRHLFGGRPSPFRPQEAIAESGLVIILCIIVVWQSLRILRRLAYFESMVVMCAWCRRVRHDDVWMPMEAFLAQHNARTSHGTCPDCAANLRAEAAAAARR